MVAPNNSSIRVLLIDDHTVMRSGLRMLIESHPSLVVVGEAATQGEALRLTARTQPDIILLDLNLCEERGADLLPNLLAAASGARVIVLTGVTDPAEHRQAILAGAMGVVLKDQALDVLVKAIEKVHDGEVWLESSMIASMLSEIARGGATEKADPEAAKLARLTTREREVIGLVGEGLKNKQIAERLFISEATVSHHLTSIFGKLEVTSRFDLLIYAFSHGLLQRPG